MRLILLFCIIFVSFNSFSQDCECTVSQVQNNSVTPCDLTVGTVFNVSSINEFYAAISEANSNNNVTILIADGTSAVASTSQYPYITGNNVVIRSASGNRNAVILTGQGMSDVAPLTEIGIYAVGNNITIADLTIRDVGNHGIAVSGDNLYVHNVRIQDTFEQMVKGNTAGTGSSNSVVQCSLFEYTAGIGPQWYIGGLDIHEGIAWRVNDNVFKDIASPSVALAEHAVHFWDFSADNLVERNIMVNCDRGIGFGLGSSPNDGGIIRNNMIYNDGSDLFHDVGIGLETSPNTLVYNNTVNIEYQNSIEYRFEATSNVDIVNNLCNQPITSRNNGMASLSSNIITASEDCYVNPSNGDLHLSEANDLAVDQGDDLGALVTDDLDKTPRPIGNALDIGAHEFSVVNNVSELVQTKLQVYPSPAVNNITLSWEEQDVSQVNIYSSDGRLVYSKINTDLKQLNLSTGHWARGVYLILLETENGTPAKRSFVLE